MADLPQELIDAIVDEVEGKDGLQSCSLTARTFLPACQRRLFRPMSLRWDTHDQALAFIDEFPHLVPHVRDVSLDIPMDPTNEVALAAIAAILRMLGNIEHLTINGRGVRWQQLVPALASAIYHILSLPSLQRLHLFRICDIPSALVLHAASSVHGLSLFHIKARASQDVPSDTGANIQLESLFLPACPITARSLGGCCNFLLTTQNLRRLAVSVHKQGHHRALAAASSSYLRHLELECGGFSIPLDLPHLPALRTMSLSFTVSESTFGVWTLPDQLRPTIIALPAVGPLVHTLTFTILIPPREICLPWHDRSALPLFDTYSSTNYRQHLPELRRINCVLGHADPSSPFRGHFALAFEGFTRYMKCKLRAAHAAGIVTFG